MVTITRLDRTCPAFARTSPTARSAVFVGAQQRLYGQVSRGTSAGIRSVMRDIRVVAGVARARALRDQAVREGDQAYGAVVMRDGVIVGEGRNYVACYAEPRSITPVRGMTVTGLFVRCQTSRAKTVRCGMRMVGAVR